MERSAELIAFQKTPNHYETVVEEIIRQCPKAGVYVDCGAHAGQHTRPMLDRGDVDRVYAIEAIPRLCDHLRRKFASETKLRLLQCAVTNRHGTGTFRIATNSPGYSSLAHRTIAAVTEWEEIQVDLRTLEELIEAPDRERVGLIKLDIEGAEFHALSGAANIMARSRPFVVFENGLKKVSESFGYEWQDFSEFWAGIGYEITDFFGNVVDRPYWDAVGQTYMYIAYPTGTELSHWARTAVPSIVRKAAGI